MGGDDPIVQRIGHRPSKSTMLVRFQLGSPELVNGIEPRLRAGFLVPYCGSSGGVAAVGAFVLLRQLRRR